MLGNGNQNKVWKVNMILAFPWVVLSKANGTHDGCLREAQAFVTYSEGLLIFQN